MKDSPKHLPASERRAVIIASVVQLAATQNPVEITTTAIAAHMGLTQGALFRHFPTKDAVWLAVMEWVSAEMLERIEQAVHRARRPLDALKSVFMTHLEFAAEHPGVPRILFGELQRTCQTPAKSVAQKLLHCYGLKVSTLIDTAKTENEIDPGINTAAAVTMFLGAIQGLVLQALLFGDVEHIRRSQDGVFALYRRALEKNA